MKTIKKNVTVTKEVDFYISTDGKEFNNKILCERHDENLVKELIRKNYNKKIPTKRITEKDKEWCVCIFLKEKSFRYVWFYLCEFPDFKSETIKLFCDYYGKSEEIFFFNFNGTYATPDEIRKFFLKQKNKNGKQILFCHYGDYFSIYDLEELLDDKIKEANKLYNNLLEIKSKI